jgi:ubiquinone/menaquinone biosynthesis C-methylase UbiE
VVKTILIKAQGKSMDPTKRFSDRVEDYVRYRPRYPTAVLVHLRDECSLAETAVIADIGSGTGILAELFLQNGNPVYGIEPNEAMRTAAESLLSKFTNFNSINGTAEATTLPDQCADFVTVGQAFHWFDPVAAGRELRRILKPEGWAVLVWNMRAVDGSPFMHAYEILLNRYAIRYQEVTQTSSHEDIPRFFGYNPHTREFPNEQLFDIKGLLGRSLSSSYAPLLGHPNHEPLVSGLRDLFGRFNENGRIRFLYTTRLYYGRLK